MAAPHQRDPTQPWRGCLALGAAVVGVPYLLFVIEFVAPQQFLDLLSSAAYFAWFVGQAILLGAVLWAGLARRRTSAPRWLGALLALFLVAMWADDTWRLKLFGAAYHMSPMNPDGNPVIALVHRWRSPAELWLLLLTGTALALAAEPVKRRWWLSRLAMVLIAVTLPLAAIELSFRAGWIDTPYTIYRGGSEVFRPNTVLGWSNAENIVTEHLSPDFRVEVRTNARGERGPDIPFERTTGRWRVLVLGDSFTFGAGVAQPETFAARLAAVRGAEVINAGVIGYSLDQEWLYLEHVGRRYQPDEVVLGLYTGNDLGELGMSASYGFARPYFTLEAGQLLPHPVAPDGAQHYETDPRPFSFVRASRALQFVQRVIAVRGYRAAHGGPSPASTLRAAPPPGWLDDPRYLAAPPRETELATALLTLIQDRCDAAGIRFTLLLIPAEELLDGPPRDGETFRLEQVANYVAARRIARELELRVVEPLAELTARRAAGESIYHPVDSHWTARGHELAAEALVAAGVGK